MAEISDKGIKVQDVTVPWEILNEHGIFRTSTLEYWARAHTAHIERVVWEAWRNHVIGGC